MLPTCPAGADAVIRQIPTPVVIPKTVHGPEAVKLIGKPAEDDAFNKNVLPYCKFARGVKLIVCGDVVALAGRIVNVPDTLLAALYIGLPGCDAVRAQLPVALSASMAEETPAESTAWLFETTEQDPVALKLTCKWSGLPPDMEVAVTFTWELPMFTELGKGPSAMV